MFSRYSLLSLALAAAFPSFAADLPLYEGETTIVTATRIPSDTARVAADTTVLTGDTLRQSGAQTLGEALATQPGISFTRDGGTGQSGALSIRGSESRHTLVLINGQRVSSATTGLTSFELLPLENIERVEIVKGPASSLYGADAVGGVIQVFTRRGTGKPYAFAGIEVGSWGQRGGYAGIGGVTGDTRYSLTLNQKQAEGFSAVSNPRSFSFDPDKDGYRRQGVAADISHFLSEKHEIGVRAFHQEQVTDIDAGMSNRGAVARQELEGAQIYLKNQWHDNWQTEFHLGQSKDRYVTDAYGSRYVTRQDQLGAQSKLKTRFGEWLLAYDYTNDKVDSSVNYTQQARRNHSALLGWQADYGMHRFEAQIRRDWNNQFGGFTTGRLGYAIIPAAGWKIYANAGRAFHAPTFNDTFQPTYLDDSAAWGYYYRYDANPNLKPEQSRSYEVGVNWSKNQHKLSLSAYRTEVRDLITLVTLTDSYANPSYPWGYTVQGMSNVSSALIKGADLRASTQISMVTLESWGTWMTARDTDSGVRLPRRAWVHGGARISVEPTAGLTSYVELTGQGIRYDDLANTKPLHGYGLVNLGVNYKISKSWQASVRLANLFDRKYELVRDYTAPGRNALLRLNWKGNL